MELTYKEISVLLGIPESESVKMCARAIMNQFPDLPLDIMKEQYKKVPVEWFVGITTSWIDEIHGKNIIASTIDIIKEKGLSSSVKSDIILDFTNMMAVDLTGKWSFLKDILKKDHLEVILATLTRRRKEYLEGGGKVLKSHQKYVKNLNISSKLIQFNYDLEESTGN